MRKWSTTHMQSHTHAPLDAALELYYVLVPFPLGLDVLAQPLHALSCTYGYRVSNHTTRIPPATATTTATTYLAPHPARTIHGDPLPLQPCLRVSVQPGGQLAKLADGRGQHRDARDGKAPVCLCHGHVCIHMC